MIRARVVAASCSSLARLRVVAQFPVVAHLPVLTQFPVVARLPVVAASRSVIQQL